MAVRYDEDLTATTTVSQLRKRYHLVEKQRILFRQFSVDLYAFVGVGRVLIFRAYGGNRESGLISR